MMDPKKIVITGRILICLAISILTALLFRYFVIEPEQEVVVETVVIDGHQHQYVRVHGDWDHSPECIFCYQKYD